MAIDNTIPSNTSILDSLKCMDKINRKLLIITEGEKFLGVLSIGDIQRAILKQVNINSPITSIVRTIITVCKNDESIEEIKRKMIELRTECMPIIDDNNRLIDVIYWEDIISNEQAQNFEQLNIPVVIMAGGEGTRLKPITNVIPKPLVPVGDKTFLEEIMDSFVKYGCTDFHISVNYKADLIQYYMEHHAQNKYKIAYVHENTPLGTAGSLHLLENIESTFFVTNCDIIVNDDYSEILKYHREHNNELTVVAALKHYSIPYGTLETKENGLLKSISEKPNLNFQINTGLYILEPHLIKEIPKDKFYHITYLIEDLQKQGRKVGVFPVSEGSWKDIGEWSEYFKILKK